MNDVVRFVESGPLLRPIAAIAGERVRVIEDLVEACEYAYHRCLTDAEDALNWTDLRELEVSEIHGAAYQDPSLRLLQDKADELAERLSELVRSRIPKLYASIIDDVSADLSNCAYSRAVFGTGDRLFDRIWNAYRQGGWPCGWIGDYPDGELVVFRPSDELPP